MGIRVQSFGLTALVVSGAGQGLGVGACGLLYDFSFASGPAKPFEVNSAELWLQGVGLQV